MKRIAAATVLIASVAVVGAREVPGFQRVTLEVAHRDPAVPGAVWYPAGDGGEMRRLGENAVFVGAPVREGASVAHGRYPVVLLSHGLGGRIGTIAWLPGGLAARGAIVIGVNHPGSTTWDFDPREAVKHWTRARDLQAALDWLLREPRWMRRIDESRIAAVGFSYGGWTVLSIGGATGNLAGYSAWHSSHCRRSDDRAADCRIIARAGVKPDALDIGRWNGSYKDGRVTAVVAIEPALHYGLVADNVRNLVDDVMLIGLGVGADRYPGTNFSPSGSGFSTLLPSAAREIIAPARHFTALATCKPNGAAILEGEGDEPICDDPKGTDRDAVHRKIVSLIAARLGLGS